MLARTQYPLSYPGYSSSLFVYTGFRSRATILTLLCNSSCSGHGILAQILLEGPCFCFAKLKRFVRLDEKKNRRIFGAWTFALYVEASIGSCCFIPAHHRVRNSFRFFALSVERPLHHYSHAHNSERVVYIQSKFTCQTICHASNHRPRAVVPTIPVYDTFCECSL